VIYAWTKSLHLLFVIAWMAAVFYLPRILVNLAEAGEVSVVRERLFLMGRRLYGFGHTMFGIAFLLGLLLWLGHLINPAWWPPVVSGMGWLHAKLVLVALLVVFYTLTGRMLKRAQSGGTLPSSKALRWFNELPILLALGAIYLVIAKPF
jgi:putative membrane protein